MITKTDTFKHATCRYCKRVMHCRLYKVTAEKGINKKLVTWGTWICAECEQLRKIPNYENRKKHI